MALDQAIPEGGLEVETLLAIANCIAQAEVLMDGYDAPDVEPYRRHSGNNPSNTIVFGALTPETLGQLIALYEHKVFVEGIVWGIDSFDQWGVEMGKKVASSLAGAVGGKDRYEGRNASTARLLETIKKLRR